MEYPIISEYIEAIEMAEDNLEALNYLRPVLDVNGKVVMSSGNFAVVFKMQDDRDGKLYAIKCFLKEQEGRAEAYHKICEALRYEDAPYFTKFEYYDDELFVSSSQTDEETFPVLLMDWVEGVPLDVYVREHIDDEYELQLLAYRFGKMASWLVMQPFAHGDLKPDNILVTKEGELKLVDYDGMYVPTMKGEQARELGSPDFRHPSRTIDDFDEHIDDFALVVILLSLKAISVNPSWLDEFGAADRLLFSEQDYRDISKCEALKAIAFSGNNELNRIVGLFYMVHSQMRLNLSDGNSFLLEEVEVDVSYIVEDALGEDEDENYDFLIRFRNGCPLYFKFGDDEGEMNVCAPRHDDYYPYSDKDERPFGKIQIPSIINYQNREYKVVGIGNYAFYDCTLLSQIKIPNSVQEISVYAFEGCTSLKEIEIPNSIENIGKSAFGNCTSLVQLKIPDSVRTIGSDAFGGCTSLVEIEIPNSIQEISDSVFYGCTSLVEIEIPNSIKAIGDCAFGECTSLVQVDIPDSVNTIGGSAFGNCTSLAKIEIPKSLQEIAAGTFYRCTSLVEVVIPDSVQIIGESAFANTSVRIINYSPNYIVEDGALYTKDKKELLYVPNNTIIFKIPNSVQTIVNSVFYGCTSLVEIEIPNSIKAIGNQTFWNCTSLKEIEIPNSLKKIGYCAFLGCTSLVEISIPDSVKEIGLSAFDGCTSLKEVFIHNRNVKFYNDSSFPLLFTTYPYPFPSHTKITYVDDYIIEDVPIGRQNINYDFLIRFKNGCPLYFKFGDNEGEVYVCAPHYDEYGYPSYSDNDERSFGKIQIPFIINYQNRAYKVVGIGKSAFNGCTSLVEIEIPDSIEMIYDNAFCGCTALVQVEIPYSVQVIDGSAFDSCILLKEIILHNRNVKYGGVSSFPSHIKISYVDDYIIEDAPKSEQNINYDFLIRFRNGSPLYFKLGNKDGEVLVCAPKCFVNKFVNKYEVIYVRGYYYADKDEKSFGKIQIPSIVTYQNRKYKVVEIEESAFKGCSLLESIEISNSVQKIGRDAFYGCVSMESIKMSNFVQEIGEWAFYSCTLLKSIEMPNSVQEICQAAFLGCISLKEVILHNRNVKYDNSAFPSHTKIIYEDDDLPF